jgi:hypothetical protein
MLHGNYSSGLTGVYKYIFPLVWIGIFGWGTLQLFINPETVSFNNVRGGAPPGTEWLFLALWLMGSGALMWLSYRLAWLRVIDDTLHITRFGRETRIPPRLIRSVEELKNVQPHMIRIRFMDETGRDRIVWVMPEFRLRTGEAAAASLVTDLQSLVQASRVSAA